MNSRLLANILTPPLILLSGPVTSSNEDPCPAARKVRYSLAYVMTLLRLLCLSYWHLVFSHSGTFRIFGFVCQ